jgi:hypothetical protein
MMDKLWTITRKATASTVNVFFVFTLTLPFYFVLGMQWWRASCIALFFIYNLALSHRCLGMIVAHTRQNLPTSPAYAALYTASAATLLFWIWFPLDVALANGLFVQLPCLLVYGNTLHGLMTGRRTMTEAEYVFECIALRGQCPDCQQTKLMHSESNHAFIYCKACHATFFSGNCFVRRVTLADISILPTGEVIDETRLSARHSNSTA